MHHPISENLGFIPYGSTESTESSVPFSYWSLAKLISVAFHAIFRHELNEFGEFFLFLFVKFAFIRVKIKKTPVSRYLP